MMASNQSIVALNLLKSLTDGSAEALTRCSVKKVFLKFRKIHRKTPVSESLLKKLQLYFKKDSRTGVFL